MLTKRIIPCLDVKDGRVVKGVKFLELRDAGDPVECAKVYDQAGADELVFLDITASHENRKTMISVVERVAESIYIPFTVGGGISDVSHMRDLLKAGCDKISINTSAIKNPELITQGARKFGSQCIVVAIDARKCGDNKWEVFTHGGRNSTGMDVLAWAQKAVTLGAGEILLTSMDRDGTKAGYDLELTQTISDHVRVPVIASGGVGELKHFYDGFTSGKADACLAASVFHFGEFSIPETKKYLSKQGISIRL